MKCFSCLQPWTSLIMWGAKHYETRKWTANVRGPVLVHASKKFDYDAQLLAEQEPFRSRSGRLRRSPASPAWLYPGHH
jgi:hypothetical protein